MMGTQMPESLFERMDKAHARRTDPETSHEAAAHATLGIERQRRLVEVYAVARGAVGFMDAQLEDAHPTESDSGLRTRRSELTARNIILDSGRRDRMPGSPRKRIVWAHRDFIDNAPPIRDAPPSSAQLTVDRAEAHAKATLLATIAAGLRRTHGLDAAATEIEAAAELLRRLAG
jgi:hypothetical protein